MNVYTENQFEQDLKANRFKTSHDADVGRQQIGRVTVTLDAPEFARRCQRGELTLMDGRHSMTVVKRGRIPGARQLRSSPEKIWIAPNAQILSGELRIVGVDRLEAWPWNGFKLRITGVPHDLAKNLGLTIEE